MRVATFNILHGRSIVDHRVDVDRFARAVRALDADILAMQEVDRIQPRSHGADLTAIAAAAMGADEHRFAATMSGAPEVWTAATGEEQPDTAGYGIALLSRFPVERWRVLALPGPARRVPMIFPGRLRPVLVQEERRAAVAAVVATPEGDLSVVATHLTYLPWWNSVQLRRLAELIETMPRPLILLGDLNISGYRPARLTKMRPLALARTFPVDLPRRQLDHILGDGPVRVRTPAVALDLGVSDHRALRVDVSLNGS